MKAKCRFFAALLLIFCMLTVIAADSDTAGITETGTEARAAEVNPNPKPQFQVNAKSAIPLRLNGNTSSP